jgi:pilus assembly protein Flp/PilA
MMFNFFNLLAANKARYVGVHIMGKFLKKKLIKGATMIEYVLIVGLIALAVVTILTTLGTTLGGSFTKVTGKLP